MHGRLALLALLVASAVHAAPHASIDATIRGTDQPLKVELLVRAGESEWRTVAHRALEPATRRVRFDALDSGIYQLLIQGPQPAEQLATKIVIGSKDERSVTITVEPVELRGRVTYGGTGIAGALVLRNREFHWRAGLEVAEDGTFAATLWQGGEFACEVRGPALTNAFIDVIDVTGARPLAIEIPEGRIRGLVRQANDGAPVAQAAVVVEGMSMTRTVTDAEGRFDFTGMKDGRYTLRVVSPVHLDAEPVTLQLGGATRQREVAIELDRGRTLPLTVIDAQQMPAAGAAVFVVAGTNVCSRALTGADGRASIAAPTGEQATLFVVPRAGSFGVQRIARSDAGPLRVHLPLASSSLLIRTRTSTGAEMPPFSLLMRFNGTVVPPEVADALASAQGLSLAKGDGPDVRLEKIPSGSYEFWPYRTTEEAEGILAIADDFAAPIQINVRTGENSVAVRFAAR